MCRVKGAGGRLDVNFTARGSGTKWTNPSEGRRIDLTVYRQSKAEGASLRFVLEKAVQNSLTHASSTLTEHDK